MKGLKKDVSVGLICVIKARDTFFAVLRHRGMYNLEKIGADGFPSDESHRLSFQVTCHGRVEKNETALDALKREINEELGINWQIVHSWTVGDRLKLAAEFIKEDKTLEKIVYTYAILCAVSDFIGSPALPTMHFFDLQTVKKFPLINPLGAKLDKRRVFGLDNPHMWADEKIAVTQALDMAERGKL